MFRSLTVKGNMQWRFQHHNLSVSVLLQQYIPKSWLIYLNWQDRCYVTSCMGRIGYSMLQKSTIQGGSSVVHPRRTFFRKKTPSELFQQDGIDAIQYDLIYEPNYTRYVFWGHLTVIATIAGAALAAVLNSGLFQYPSLENPFFETPLEMAIIVGLWFLFNSGIIYMGRHCVLRAYYSQEHNNFIFVFLRLFPFLTRTMTCRPGEVEHLEKAKMSVIGTHKMKGYRLVLSPEYFKYPVYYNVLMGYSPPDILKEELQPRDPH